MKLFLKILGAIVLLLAALYLLAWSRSSKDYEPEYGISFSQEYAGSLGLDWRVAYTAMLEELSPKYVRIAAMWKQVEPEKFVYDFSEVDFMMDEAAKHGTKVTLVVGQKAPRWPECHVPQWLDYGQEVSKEHLLSYVEAVVERYKTHEALELWQIENEAFIHFTFGECEGYLEDAIYEEIELVKSLDTEHKILVTDSGELGLWRKAAKAGDYFGTTLYRIVRTPGGTIINYDWLPPAVYRWKAFLTGVDKETFFIAELQGEPWFTDGNPTNTDIEQQELTMNPERLQKHIDYANRIGAKRVYLWGVEWWQFMRTQHDDARYWDIAKETMTH
ncbi:MAG: hypothetical protein HOE53_02400 [Candidatus Magasanikbacteria bacterium]|jgi:hypothetical protein|nr:hypothetical protein [Candidatus Magasanikbacteria bacterium]